ncbi:unnamed protein product [Penicillium pancosmium]
MHLAKKKSTNLLDYAVPVSPELYANSSEYASRLKPKIHKHSQVADDACIQYQIDFIGREHIGKFAGSLNPICGSVIALAFPYTLPENLALVAYMCESGAVADDIEEAFLASNTAQNAVGIYGATPSQNLLAGFDQSTLERV